MIHYALVGGDKCVDGDKIAKTCSVTPGAVARIRHYWPLKLVDGRTQPLYENGPVTPFVQVTGPFRLVCRVEDSNL